MKYEYPKFYGRDYIYFRVGGQGLANLLFPWARAYVATLCSGSALIRPTWPQLKVRPFLRGEMDSRVYVRLLKVLPDEVSGLRRLGLAAAVNAGVGTRCGIRVHSGMKGFFDEFLPNAKEIRDRLSTHCFDSPDDAERSMLHGSIGVHVRLGDFRLSDDPLREIRSGRNNVRQPLSWYVERMHECLARGDGQPRFSVFSDGSDGELREVLAVPGAIRVRSRDALSDLLRLASCRSLIASNSTYSMWAAFLMERPSVWFPGALKTRVNLDPSLATEKI